MYDAGRTSLLQSLKGRKRRAVLSVGYHDAVGFSLFQFSAEGQLGAGIGAQLQHGKVTAEHRPALHVIHVHIQLHIFGNGISRAQANLDVMHLRVADGDVVRNQKYLFAIGRRGVRSLLRRIGDSIFAGICRSSGSVTLWQQKKKQYNCGQCRQNAQRLRLKRYMQGCIFLPVTCTKRVQVRKICKILYPAERELSSLGASARNGGERA